MKLTASLAPARAEVEAGVGAKADQKQPGTKLITWLNVVATWMLPGLKSKLILFFHPF